MKDTARDTISYLEADEALRDLVAEQWREYFPSVGHYIRLKNGFTIVAMDGEQAVGLITVKWQNLTPPISDSVEGHIEDIEVVERHRRCGIATQLIEEAMKRARARDACQLRAWSSYDKVEAIPMWRALGFGLCPSSIISSKTGEEVSGYFVAKAVREEAQQSSEQGAATDADQPRR